MTAHDEHTKGEAAYLLSHPIINNIYDGLERAAFEDAAAADVGDDATRRDAMLRVQAIRSLRRELEAIAHPAAPPKRGVVA